MLHREVRITELDQVRVQLDDIQNILSCKCITSQPFLDLTQRFHMDTVTLVKNRGESGVFVPQTVQEVLSEDPPDVTVDTFLNCTKDNKLEDSTIQRVCTAHTTELSFLEELLKGSDGQAVDQTGFLHDLVDGMLDGRAF